MWNRHAQQLICRRFISNAGVIVVKERFIYRKPPDSPAVSRREFFGGFAGFGLAAGLTSARAPAAMPGELPVTPKELWAWVRAQQVLDPAVAHLDTGTLGPGLRISLAAEFRHQELFNSDPENYRRTFFSPAALTACMGRFAALLGCDVHEVALTHGATEALNIVANGLKLNAGDEVIVTHHAHSSALYPWMLQAQRHGIVLKQLSLPSPTATDETLGRIAAAVSDRTRVITLSHLQHTDGAILPLADICSFAKQRNIFSVIDGAQACGAIHIAVKTLSCDFYAASLHKWLNAPLGHGLLYVRGDLLNALAPGVIDSNAAWNTLNRFGQASIDDERSDWPLTLRKFSNATRLIGPRLKGIEAALDFRDQLGGERIETRGRELALYMRARLQPFNHVEILTPDDAGASSGIITFRLRRGSAKGFVERIKRDERIIASAITWPSSAQSPAYEAVRVCMHIYNSHEDIDRFVRVVRLAG